MLLTLLLAIATATSPPEGVQSAQPSVQAGDYPYQLFVPYGYGALRQQVWPLVIFLHGGGSRGTDVARVLKMGLPFVIRSHPGSPFLMVSPQLGEVGDWDVVKLDRLLERIRKTYRVDSTRIYLTGLSRGGIGTWAWAAVRPELFAAVIPVAAQGDPAVACRLKDTPVWAFHGDHDPLVPPIGDFAMVEAIRACPGAISPRLTIYPDTSHSAWESAYNDPALYRWMLEQRRKVPAP